MFLNFFGLREQPFGVTPDPRFLYLSSAHRGALASLFYGIESDLGFLALVAKPGMGKTTLPFHLLEKFRSSARTAFLCQTQCTSRQFMRFLLGELGFETDRQDFVRSYEECNKYLLQEARAGNRFLVPILKPLVPSCCRSCSRDNRNLRINWPAPVWPNSGSGSRC